MSAAHAGGISGSGQGVFEKALSDFKKELKPKDENLFRHAKLADLLDEIDELQRDQNSSRRLQAIGRIKPTLEALTQLGKVIEVFVNGSEYVAYIWGPMKFLLQTASQFADAFNGLLDVYEDLGQRLPVISQYEKLFRHDRNMGRVLGYLYKDILEFHRRALKFFHQPMWRQLFQATWKTHQSRFEKVIQDINRHCSIVESQAVISRMQESVADRMLKTSQLQTLIDNQELQWKTLEAQEQNDATEKARKLYSWLKAANVKNDQDHFRKTRTPYPGTGRWLLKHNTFKSWFEPMCQIVPPILWVNGIPGAGKTILASLVVEEAQKMVPQPAVLFFYCKQGDSDRDNFSSICRSFLSQLLECNKDILLPFYFDTFSRSTEPVLSTQATIEELLTTALKNCPSVYIILDGIDECSREERLLITGWVREVVEALPPTNMDQMRCLFVSQDDGFARKDFAGLTSLKIQPEDSSKDIQSFSSKWALDIQKKFTLTDAKCRIVQSKIQNAAGGMFLLAKLISTNLLGQTTLDRLEYELESQQLPKELNAAYARIISRIFDQATDAEQEDSRMLLGWLVCAKRPLKWHEIQAAKSIDLDSQSVDFAQWEFKVDSKDLCGSLVEIRPGMTVELIHTTARTFLTRENHVQQHSTELELAELCVNYLNFCGLTKHAPPDIGALILDGYYVFMDYAIIYWIRHLETALSATEDIERPRLKTLGESLEIFLEHHYIARNKVLPLSQKNARRLQRLESTMDPKKYRELQQGVVSIRKQLTFCGELKTTEMALDLSQVVEKIRGVLEPMALPPTAPDRTARILETYGPDLFRCPKLSCKFFSSGFDTRGQRDQHLEKHNRPFLCTVVGCPSAAIGFSSEKELEKHTNTSHPSLAGLYEEDDYPDENAINAPSYRSSSPNSELKSGSGSGSESSPIHEETETQELKQGPQQKPVPQTHHVARNRYKKTYRCQTCEKIFNRKFNYNSHLLTHGITTGSMWDCRYCDKKFPRKSDWTRHELGHDSTGHFTCGDGTWGCGKKFARRDTLANHHRSKKGRRCIAAFNALRPWAPHQQ